MNKIFSIYKKYIFASIFILLAIILPLASYSQINHEYYENPQKGETVDSILREKTPKFDKEKQGLLEKEIDPTKYLIGPNDIITISIVSTKAKIMDLTVSPEGKLLIPNVGVVNLKGLTLAQGVDLIEKKVRGIYKSDDISVSLKELRQFKVSVSGAVRSGNIVPATAADRVSEVIEKAGGLKQYASQRKIKLLRDDKVIPVDLIKYFRAGDKNSNPTVLGGDQVIVPSNDLNHIIGIYGEVSAPGDYEYVEGDSLSTLMKYGLGYFNDSFLDSVEVARFGSDGIQIDRQYLKLSNWQDIYNGVNKLDGDIPLNPGDRVFIRQVRDKQEIQKIEIVGEVNYPGFYPISKNHDRVRDVLMRAGGFTNNASLEGVVLTRKKEMKVEDPEMDRLWRTDPKYRMKSEERYFQARVREKRGVMSLDFSKILKDENCIDNIILEDQDSLFVPHKKLFVNVQGRVNNPGLVVYNPNYTYMDYISNAGGFGYRADEGETLIVKAKGDQYSATSTNYILEPGDYILVPPQSEVTFLEVFTDALTILAQLVTVVGVILTIVKLKG